MGALTKLFRSHEQSGVINPAQWFLDLLGGGPSATGITVDQTSALTSGVVFACIRIIAETIASVPLFVYDESGDGSKAKAPKNPMYRLLHDAPNPEMSSSEWREAQVGSLLAWGNSYSEIQRDQGGRPIAIWPLRPDRIIVWRDPITFELDYQFSAYRGGIIHIAPEDVLHVRLMSRDGIMGMSPIQQAREAIAFDLALEKFGNKFFGSGARPGGGLSIPRTITPEGRKNIRESWERDHMGLDQSNRVAMFEEGVAWVNIGIPPEEAQFLGSRTWSINNIARIFRVPPHLLQELTRATNNNIEHQGLDFVTHTIRPHTVRYEQRYQQRLFPIDDSHYARYALDGLLRGDLAGRYTAYGQGRQWGWLSVNDVRDREDMNSIGPKGDEYLRPVNMAIAGQPAPTPQPPAPPSDQPGDPDPGDGGEPARQLLRDVALDAAQRIVRRERQDVLLQARKLLGRGDRDGFRSWAMDFHRSHRAYVEQQTRPVLAGMARMGQKTWQPEQFGQLRAAAVLDVITDCLDAPDAGSALVRLEAKFNEADVDAPGQVADVLTAA